MLNPFAEVNWSPGRDERRKFAVSLMIGFPCVAAALLAVQRLRGLGWSFDVPFMVAGCGLALGLALWVVPRIAWPFYVGWYALACGAGFVIGNTLLAAVYLLMFVPLGLALRVLRRQTLRKGLDRKAATYWREARTPVDIERYYRQF